MWEGIWHDGAFASDHLVKVMSEMETWRATWHSISISSLGTLISLLLGSVFAFMVALTDIRGKAALVFCFMLPMMIPPQITALSWLQLFGPTSSGTHHARHCSRARLTTAALFGLGNRDATGHSACLDHLS